MVRIGIAGSGYMAKTHVDAYAGIDDAEIVAVASPNTAEAFVDDCAPGAVAYASANTMIETEELDAVDICSPTPTHRPLVETATERDLAVFCEKPIAGSLSDAEALEATVEEHGITFMVGHVLRFFPEYAEAKATVDDGGIGTPGIARARRLSPYPEWGRGGWYAEESGGVLLDLSIHDFDFLRWVFGGVSRVFARRERWENAEHAHTTLRFENGAVGSVEGSWALPSDRELTSSLELAGADGLIRLDGGDPPVELIGEGEVMSESPIGADGYRRELREFVDCVQHGGSPTVGASEAIQALRVSLAAMRSAERGTSVDPTEVGR